jgi:type I restriction enzyme, S subunit
VTVVTTTPIGLFCQIGSGTTPPRSAVDRYYGGGIPWVKSGELREKEIEKTEETVTEEALKETPLKLVPPGTLLVAMYGATVGRTGILRIPATTNQAVCHIIPDKNIADTKYLFFALNYLQPSLIGKSVGGAQPNISQEIIRRTEVRLPPLAEQRRIAAILDQADALRRKRRVEALELLGRLSSSIFDAAFSGNNATSELGSLTTQIYRYPTYYNIEYVPDGVPEIRGEMILEGGQISEDDGAIRFIADATSRKFPKTVVEAGDLVMSVRGTVGKLGLIPASLSGANITANLIRIAPDRKKVDPVFLWHAMQTRGVRRALAKSSSTTTIATIKAPDLKALVIAWPPLERQRIFVARVAEIAKLEAQHRAHLGELDALFASLQHRAFRGEL